MSETTFPDPIDASPEPVPGRATEPAVPDERAPGVSRRLAVVTAAGVLVLAAAGFWAWGAAGESRYAAAASALTTQIADETTAFHAQDARRRNVVWLAGQVGPVVASPAFGEGALAEADALRQALAGLGPLVQASGAPDPRVARDGTVVEDGYRLPWVLMAAAERLEIEARSSGESETALLEQAEEATTAGDTLTAAEAAYFTATARRAEETIAANGLADRSVQVALVRFIEQARVAPMASSRDGVFLAAMVAAEAQVRESHALHQAQLDDPEWAVRSEIEQYARSLSNGVALEFVWAREVSGLGGDWLSGTAQTYDTDGGWSIISLNYTIEEAWYDGSGAHALVAHEVGHAQVYREACWPLFSGATFAEDQETWATAWSMSHGFEAGSGIESYGRPTDEQVAVAGQCR